MFTTLKSRFLSYLIIGLAFFISISQYVSVRLSLIVMVIALIGARRRKSISDFIQIWDIIFFVSIIIVGLFFSDDINTGIGLVETSFTLFSIPMIFYLIPSITKEKLQSLNYAFCSGLFIASFLFLGTNSYQNNTIIGEQFFSSNYINKLFGFDPTYFSYYLIFAITFCLYLLYFNEIIKRRGYVVGLVIFFFIILTLTAGTSSYINILLVLAFFILKFLTEPKRDNYKLVVFGLSLVFLFSLFLISYFNIAPLEGRDYWERFVLWEAAIKATPNLLIGVGTGDYNIVLNEYYRTHNLSQFSLSNYNAHNQFIQTLLSNGIIGLMALLIMMIRPLYLSIKYQNPLGILVFFSFFVYGLTEVFLGRYQGVVFFALMHQSFISYYYSQSKLVAVKE